MEIELRTSDGHFVAVVEVPPFKSCPDVVAWGDRVFRYEGWDPPHRPSYLECFAVASFTPSPGLPR